MSEYEHGVNKISNILNSAIDKSHINIPFHYPVKFKIEVLIDKIEHYRNVSTMQKEEINQLRNRSADLLKENIDLKNRLFTLKKLI